jgi:hypothetical protein
LLLTLLLLLLLLLFIALILLLICFLFLFLFCFLSSSRCCLSPASPSPPLLFLHQELPIIACLQSAKFTSRTG